MDIQRSIALTKATGALSKYVEVRLLNHDTTAEEKPKKPNEIPVPGKNPETIPTPEPAPGIWPKKEPEIQPRKEPLTTPPAAPPEVPKPPEGIA